jgi:Fe-S-cluster containining protein
LLQSFAGAIERDTLPQAMRRYQETIGALITSGLTGKEPACGAGCAACCHQPIGLSFLELAWLYFSDEERFSGDAFQARLTEAREHLMTLRGGQKRVPPRTIALRQLSARYPCVMLDDDLNCSVEAVKPLVCRVTWSMQTCTFTHMPAFQVPGVAALGRYMRHLIHERFELGRYAPSEFDTATAVFYLPEGFYWLQTYANLDELRPIFDDSRARSP